MQKRALLIIAAILIVGGGAYAIAHKSKTNTPSAPAYSSPTASNTPSNQNKSSTASVVQTKTSSSLGQYLATSSGSALYTYGLDTSGVSNCTGSCLTTWPIYVATSSSASLPANVKTFTRSDGGLQYSYKGMPLYTFTGDSSGQVSGDGVNNFHVAKP
jgi:predicted lipoprotein with Yx(FWY)xxD motif